MDSQISKKAFLLSAGLHLFVLLLLVLSLAFSEPMPVVSNNDTQVIQAIALEDSPILAPPTKALEKPQQEVKEPPLVKQEPQPVQPKPAAPKPAPKPDEAKAPEASEKLALPLHKKLVKKELSKQLLADLRGEIAKQTQLKHKKIKDKFSRELKIQSEKTMRQLLKEQQQLTGQRSQHKQGVINKYKALILQAIGREWIVPPHVDKSLFCELLIRLGPGGVVLDVTVTHSSGDTLLDRSARTAVFKASPLPVPTDILSFEPFQHFVLKVKPENIVENKGDSGFWLS